MSLSPAETDKLLQLIAATVADEMDCDECLELLPLFVEITIASKSLPPALICVEIHLQQCPCCHEEYEIILASVRRI